MAPASTKRSEVSCCVLSACAIFMTSAMTERPGSSAQGRQSSRHLRWSAADIADHMVGLSLKVVGGLHLGKSQKGRQTTQSAVQGAKSKADE